MCACILLHGCMVIWSKVQFPCIPAGLSELWLLSGYGLYYLWCTSSGYTLGSISLTLGWYTYNYKKPWPRGVPCTAMLEWSCEQGNGTSETGHRKYISLGTCTTVLASISNYCCYLYDIHIRLPFSCSHGSFHQELVTLDMWCPCTWSWIATIFKYLHAWTFKYSKWVFCQHSSYHQLIPTNISSYMPTGNTGLHKPHK